jgi:hypothetical protein
MVTLGWSSVIQAVIVASCSWYVRRGQKRDTAAIRTSSEAHLTVSEQILNRLSGLEVDMTMVKRCMFKDNDPKSSMNAETKGLKRGKSI